MLASSTWLLGLVVMEQISIGWETQVMVSLVLKDSDTDSENLSSLIRLSVSDGQKTGNSNLLSFIGI